ncbi:nitrate reductase molybdenum cofactor assembly chaperone [Nocardioides sp. LMS-CY]|uniref:Nitrate reductase delta subunit n=1 Tax=Nocardioides soli TaxID=1036020 RepID=A0A7W4Z3X4_9ACTN|nr:MULTISPECIES: nitrate reductase molybdenum cofactor assembly chaperone [Nocardioides]MBB3045467.1 nitrate reductase delta subunit [Nocardioides soli]QWF22460.1 nitrate reductase molybdenum cofactor assembly chaperone [Nocardioides sp. LMS-CY]
MRARVTRQAASYLLAYPDQALLDRVPLLRDALAEQGVDGLDAFLDHLEGTPLRELERQYVEVFDLSRRHALYLSYWTDGDTRRRGEVLARFKAAYRACGFVVDTSGELPDYLPMVLEFAAIADPEVGETILREYRPSLELLRIGLEEDGAPYAEVVAAVCATLPGASPADRAAVQAMVGGPPTEFVGLEPYDPRLLPMANSGGERP